MITSLQIGSGKADERYRTPEWINIDLVRHKPRGRFLVADGCELPFSDGQFDTIHAIHVLEHLPRVEKRAKDREGGHLPFLKECARVLSASGSLFVEVPDFLSVCRQLVEAADRGLEEEVRIRTVGIYGKGRHFGDFHHWGWSPWYLEQKIREAGLECERSYEMISGHWRQEPVILMRCFHG